MTQRRNYIVEYFDLVQDVNATLIMSQIHYWYMPGKNGKSKLRVQKNGNFWISKSYIDWWNEVRLNRRQVDRALKVLIDANLIKVQLFKFDGSPTRHIRCEVLDSVPIEMRDSMDIVGAFTVP